MRNTDISCINKDDLVVYTDYKQTNEQKMIHLHYVTDLKKVNNQKKVFFAISQFFLLPLTFFDLQGLAGLSSTNCDSGIQPTRHLG